MTAVAIVLLALGVLVAWYAYFGYPLLLRLVGLARPRPAPAPEPAAWPRISVTVPAYNEERAIAATLDAILATDYPADRRQVLVVSDGSTDRTDEIVRGYAARGVELLRTPSRGGKIAAENLARAHLTGDIVVNTDASVRIAPGAIKPLVARFADPTVGVASGRDVSVAELDRDLNVGESGYVGYEMKVRDLETRVGSIVGASGCFYAIRRELHLSEFPPALSRDFACALIARERGFRAVSVNEAVCYVPRIRSLHREYRRKVRTLVRGLETLWYKRALLNPLRYGAFAWMLASHKLVRWLAPWGLALAAAGWLLLAWALRSWPLALVCVVPLVLAAVGWWWPETRRAPRLVAVPAYVVSGVVAALEAWIRALRGEVNAVWEPTKRTVVR
ncbi:MAG TPA: glycosyltransferase [Gemmatimonadales bacterium]|nr:glycosyltransferase [Gemmatimonadales bacterium]